MHDGNEGESALTLRQLIEKLAAHAPRESRYVRRGEIARGGMGSILEVWDTDLRRSLAMKTIRSANDEEPSEDLLARFLEEAQVTAQLDHPGVVPVHELGVDDRGQVYFTMTRVRGRDLRGIFGLARGGREGWNLTRALGVLLKVCEALAYAHSKGIVHRDLKPANVMVGPFGEVYVMDWGIAKVLGSAATAGDGAKVATDRSEAIDDASLHTLDGTIIGTPAYMSIEQARGEVEGLDARADVYSVGAMLYELLSGWAPYSGPEASPSSLETLNALRSGPPLALAELVPDAPPELVAIAEKAMARDRDDRYPETMEMAEDLRAFLESRVVRAYRTGPVVELTKWIRRNRGTAAALLAFALVLVAGLGSVSWVQATGRARAERDLGRIRGLSDVKRLRELKQQEASLWPPLPGRVDDLATWLADARAVHANLPLHQETRRRLEARALPVDAEQAVDDLGVTFEDLFDRWQYAEVLDLIAETLSLPPLIEDVEARRAFASTVEMRTVSGADAAKRWAECLADVASLGVYAGVDLVPQIGLLPLRRDADSGLWEFAHVQSGELPAWEAEEGRYASDGERAIILVLLPGGECTVGAWSESHEHERGTPFVDPHKQKQDVDEGPPRSVRLDPFFVSKFELTQAQWARVMGEQPSFRFAGGAGEGALFPVQLVTWNASLLAVRRMDLELPTETQWEYACRAGTTTPFSTGEATSSLEDYANIADSTFIQARVNNGGFVNREVTDGFVYPAPVGSFLPNDFGLYDVHGNVWEWCRDLYARGGDPREGDGARDAGAEGPNRTFRGGSWFASALSARSANRFSWPPGSRESDVGLRPVRRLDP